MLVRGRFAAIAVFRDESEPTLVIRDRGSGLFLFASAGGCGGYMSLLQVINAFVASACSAAGGAAGGRGAAASSSMSGSSVPHAASMGPSGRRTYSMARVAGGCFPSSCLPAATSVTRVSGSLSVRHFFWSLAGEG